MEDRIEFEMGRPGVRAMALSRCAWSFFWTSGLLVWRGVYRGRGAGGGRGRGWGER